MLLRSADVNEQVTARDGTACRAHLAIAPTLLATLLTAALLGLTANLNMYLVRINGLTIDGAMSRRNGEGTILGSYDDIGIGH